MKELLELTHVVNKNKIKRIDLLDSEVGKKTKVGQLYNLLCDGKILDDQQAINNLGNQITSRSAFMNTKAKLRAKLLNTLFFVDVSQPVYNDRQAAYHSLHKTIAAAYILLGKHATQTAMTEFKKAAKRALHFEFTELALIATRQLSIHYAVREGNLRKFEEYQKLVNNLREKERAEAEAEAAYCELIVHYVNNKSRKNRLDRLAARKLERLHEIGKQLDSYGLRLYTFLIELFHHTSANNYVSALPVTRRMIQYFQKKPYDAYTPIQIALHHQMVGFLQAGEESASLQALLTGRKMLQEGSFNWFKNLEYHFLHSMHTDNYGVAIDVYLTAVTHRKFNNLPANVQEVWTIYHAYLSFLMDSGEVNLPLEAEQYFTTFRINRFLNDLPLYSKDKSGMNIAVLIIQILFYLQKQQFDQVIDRIESIEKYCSRYLMQSDLSRAYYFIKLLLVLPKAGFNRMRAVRYAKSQLEKLEQHSPERVHSFHKIEIIPFEKLWQMTQVMLFERAKEFKL